MKNLTKYLFILFALGFIIPQKINAQNPNWSFNSANYQQSMTFTAFLNVDGVTLTSASDQVAAFVGEEIRGLASIQYVPSANKYLAYLTVFSNTNGETISFKIYQSNSNSVVTIDKTEVFAIDSNKGGIFQSYSIAKPQLNNEAKVNTYSFLGINSVSSTIGESQIDILVPYATNISNLKAIYGISNGAKVFVSTNEQTSGVSELDYSSPVNFQVLSEDQSILNNYLVNTSIEGETFDPSTVLLNGPSSFTNNKTIIINANFSQNVLSLEDSNFTLKNAIISNISNTDNKNYEITLIPQSQGECSIEMPYGSVSDVNGNLNLASNKVSFIYDINKPIVTSIKAFNGENSRFFEVEFNEEVLNVNESDLYLIGAASDGEVISNLSAKSTTKYEVSISQTASANGTISLGISDESDIIDLSGNKIAISINESFYITKKPITITADTKTKVYGETDPSLTYQITTGSLLDGETHLGELSRDIGEDVGSYTISSTLAHPNYEITFIPASLTITKKPITIAADTKTKVYGETDPGLTYQITTGSLLDGETLLGELSRDIGEDVGSYTISSTLAHPNYEITFIPASLTITESVNDGGSPSNGDSSDGSSSSDEDSSNDENDTNDGSNSATDGSSSDGDNENSSENETNNSDLDNDDVDDSMDNCPSLANSNQLDTDGDGIGNICDDDDDNDGVLDINDNCTLIPNSDQLDTDGDGIGDVCDQDNDNDGIPDVNDNCPYTPSTPYQLDFDGDGIGDVCDDDDDNDGVLDTNDNCPNTPDGANTDANGCLTFILPANNFNVLVTSSTCIGSQNGALSVSALDQNYNYKVSVTGQSSLNLNTSNNYSASFLNLNSGNYNVCFTVDGLDYEQCYSVNVTQPDPLSAYLKVNMMTKSLGLSLNGSGSYNIKLNGAIIKTNSSNLSLDLKPGMNYLSISTDLDCQGTYFKEIFVSEDVLAYPNPTEGMVQLYIGGSDDNVTLNIYDINSQNIISKSFEVSSSRVIEADISRFKTGVYFFVLDGKTIKTTHKIIKK